MPRSYILFDLELAAYVTDWGEVEEVKDILLAQSQLFTAQHTIVLANADNRFSPKNTQSPFYGRNTQLAEAFLSVNGPTLYQGFVRSIEPDHKTRTVKILTQNSFTVPANTNLILQTSGNPAAVIREILESVGLSNYIDYSSFQSAGGGASSAGASIAVNYEAGDNTTALAAIQSICSLCSFSCFVQAGKIKLKAWQPYQGNNSGIKYAVTSAQVYDFSTLSDAYTNLSNSVTILYATDSELTLTNPQSIRANGITPNTEFNAVTAQPLSVPDLVSANYFGDLFLSRSSTLRQQGSFTAGPTLNELHIGDRITVDAPNWGSAPIAFEVIETHLEIEGNNLRVVCATI